MTIEQVQRAYDASLGLYENDFDKSVAMVAACLGMTVPQVEKLRLRVFNRYVAKINKAFEAVTNSDSIPLPKRIRAGRRVYWVDYDAAATAGRYVEGITFGNDVIANLHKLMASVVRPMTWYGKVLDYDANKHSRYAEDMKRVDFRTAYAIGVFFYRLYTELMRTSQPYMIQEAILKGATKEEVIQSFKDLQAALDGSPLRSKSLNLKELN